MNLHVSLDFGSDLVSVSPSSSSTTLTWVVKPTIDQSSFYVVSKFNSRSIWFDEIDASNVFIDYTWYSDALPTTNNQRIGFFSINKVSGNFGQNSEHFVRSLDETAGERWDLSSYDTCKHFVDNDSFEDIWWCSLHFEFASGLDPVNAAIDQY